jgi:hyperosmotically inducible periplasmic protein
MKRIVPIASAFMLMCTIGMARADQPAADNTGVNARDKSGSTLTASDQPNNQADVSLTAAVRQSIVNDDKLSMSAHNVKVIAMNGVVTLRGPVNNAQEKALVAEKAKTTAGVKRVDNQLEVVSQ